MTQEREATIEAIVRETLAERFTNAEFVFDPIRVVPAVDEWGPHASGEDYLEIFIVFDGDRKNLDPGWTSTLIRRLENKLIPAGIAEFPSPSWVAKSEWPWLERKLNHDAA